MTALPPEGERPSTDTIEQARRLSRVRMARGFPSARAAALHHGWNVTTYTAHEKGTNGFALTVEKYAQAYMVSAAWLLTGEGDRNENIGVIPLVGNVGEGGEISTPASSNKPSRVTEVRLVVSIPGATWAFKIEGRDHYPRYDEGSLLIVKELERNPLPLVGKECVVYTADGKSFVRTLRHGSKEGLFNLEHFRAPAIENVEVRAVGKICAAIPADEWESHERRGTPTSPF